MTAPGAASPVATAAGAMPSVAMSVDAVLCVCHCATHRSEVCCNGQIATTTSVLPCVVTVTDSVRPLHRLQALHYYSRRRHSQSYCPRGHPIVPRWHPMHVPSSCGCAPTGHATCWRRVRHAPSTATTPITSYLHRPLNVLPTPGRAQRVFYCTAATHTPFPRIDEAVHIPCGRNPHVLPLCRCCPPRRHFPCSGEPCILRPLARVFWTTKEQRLCVYLPCSLVRWCFLNACLCVYQMPPNALSQLCMACKSAASRWPSSGMSFRSVRHFLNL